MRGKKDLIYFMESIIGRNIGDISIPRAHRDIKHKVGGGGTSERTVYYNMRVARQVGHQFLPPGITAIRNITCYRLFIVKSQAGGICRRGVDDRPFGDVKRT